MSEPTVTITIPEDMARRFVAAFKNDHGQSVSIIRDAIAKTLVPSEPPMRSTVLDSDGDAWQRRPTGTWRCTSGDMERPWDLLCQQFGPVTIIHTPKTTGA